jgi:hypothetical protein
MSAIGKGDFVEALSTWPCAGVTKGVIYRVCEIIQVNDEFDPCELCGDEGDGLRLDGVPMHPDHALCHCGFKPISGGAPGMFSHLLKQPTDAPREPVAA